MSDAALAASLFDALHGIGFDGVGITRESFSPAEDRAFALIEDAARAAGLECARDAVANLVCMLPGQDRSLPAAACGSHLDSVPQGGNFDGAAGVVAGLLALRRLAQGPRPRRSAKLFVLRGEESAWFGKPYLGSSAMLGALSADDLDSTHVRTGETLAQRMGAVGIDVAPMRRGERLIDPATLACFLELHIEQGPVLVARNMPVAVVTGIRGNFRHRAIRCEGEAGHSGAVPRWLRHDAVFAVAELIGQADRHWQNVLARGQDLVMTAGIVATDTEEHAVSRIPGRVAFSFEARSESLETLDGVHDVLEEDCRVIGEERGVRFVFDRRIDNAPARMDAGMVEVLCRCAEGLGLPAERMASGAGHDAAVFANAGVPAGMVFVRNAHGSHNPAEAMEMADFLGGAAVLHAALADMVAR